MKKIIQIFLNGILKENPVLIMAIGLCPVLACSTTATDAVGMSIAATFVLVCSNFIVSMIRKIIPTQIRIPVFIVIIATFTTIVDYVMQAYAPRLSDNLGVFVPLIVVNCIILARAEAFAYKNSVVHSIVDGLGMGFGFFVAIVSLGIIREFLGSGTIFNSKPILSNPAVIMILPPGAFLVIGCLVTLVKYIENKVKKDKKKIVSNLPSECEGCTMKLICIGQLQANIKKSG